MIGDMKIRGNIPVLIAVLGVLGMAICLWVRTRGWQRNFPDPLTYAFVLASALILTRRLMNLINRHDEQSKEPSVEQSSDQIDDAQ